MKKVSTLNRKDNRIAVLTIFPIFLYHFVVVVVPFFNTIYSSFTNWNGLKTKDFIGFDNYINLFHDPSFFEAATNNLKWMLVFVTVPVVIGLLVGYVLAKVKKGRSVLRACYFLPYVISAAIAGKIFAAFFNPYLGVNSWLEQIGLGFLQCDWLAPDNALMSVASVDVWHWWGFLLVIFISALQQIDPMLYESAEVEGANELQKLWYITIPCIKDTLIFIILVSMVWSIGTFDYVWVMTKGSPGTELLSTMMYKAAMLKYQAGYGCAISVIQSLLAFLIFGVFNRIRARAGE